MKKVTNVEDVVLGKITLVEPDHRREITAGRDAGDEDLRRVAAVGCDILKRPSQGRGGVFDVNRMRNLRRESIAHADDAPAAIFQLLGNRTAAAGESAAVIVDDGRKILHADGTIEIEPTLFLGVLRVRIVARR